MIMKNTIQAPLAAGLCALLLLGGCGKQETRYVDTTGGEALVTRGKINVQEWYKISNELVNKMLNDGAFARAPMRPATIKVSFIKNDTNGTLDTEFLTDEVINQLNQSNQAVVTATYKDLRGQSEDALAAKAQQERDASQQLLDEFEGNYDATQSIKDAQTRIPFYTLSGSVKEDYVRQGDVRQSTFIVYVKLIETTSGRQVWSGRSTPITKQSENASVGW